MIEDKDRGLGKCRCGKWAIVGFNGVNICEEHMKAAFRRTGSSFDQLKRLGQ